MKCANDRSLANCPPRRRLRRVWRALWGCGAMGTLLTAAGYYAFLRMTDPVVLARWATQAVRSQFGFELQVGRAEFKWPASVVLSECLLFIPESVAPNEMAPDTREFSNSIVEEAAPYGVSALRVGAACRLKWDHARLAFDPWSVWSDSPRILRLDVHEADLEIEMGEAEAVRRLIARMESDRDQALQGERMTGPNRVVIDGLHVRLKDTPEKGGAVWGDWRLQIHVETTETASTDATEVVMADGSEEAAADLSPTQGAIEESSRPAEGEGSPRATMNGAGRVTMTWSDPNPGAGDAGFFGVAQWDRTSGRLRYLQARTPFIEMDLLERIAEPMAAMAPEAAAPWMREIKARRATGEIRLAECRYDARSDEHDGTWSVEVEARNAGLALMSVENPAEAADLCPYEKVDEVSGRFTWRNGEGRLQIAGRFAEAPCRLVARTLNPESAPHASQEAGGDWQLQIEAEDLTLPRYDDDHAREKAFVDRQPLLAELYDRFRPAGIVDLDAAFFVRGLGDPAGPHVDLGQARLFPKDCHASYHLFLYPCHVTGGLIEFSPAGVVVNGLQAEHEGAKLTVNAWAAKVSGPVAARVNVHAKRVALDDDLRTALPAEYQAAWRQFDVDGAADIIMSTRRLGEELGDPETWHYDITARLDGVALRYRPFPFALESVVGTLRTNGRDFRADDVTGRHGDAQVSLEGSLSQHKGAITALDLFLRADDVSVDDAFMDSLPARMREKIEALSPVGTFDAQATLGWERGALIYDADVYPDRLTLKTSPLGLPFEDLCGVVRITPEILTLNQVGGRWAGRFVVLDGHQGLMGDRGVCSFEAQCNDFALCDAVWRLLPKWVQPWIDEEGLSGGILARMERPPQADAGDVEAEISQVHAKGLKEHLSFSRARVRPSFLELPVEDAEGEVRLEDGRLEAFRLSGRYRDGLACVELDRLSAGGFESGPSPAGLPPESPAVAPPEPEGSDDQQSVEATSGAPGALVGRAALERLDFNDLRSAPFSAEVRCWLGAHDPRGLGSVTLETLRIDEGQAGASAELSLKGRASFEHLAVNLPLKIEEAAGGLDFEGEWLVDRSAASFAGSLELKRAMVQFRSVADLSARWSLARAAGGLYRVRLDDIAGRCAGGALSGELEWGSDGDKPWQESRWTLTHASLMELFAPGQLGAEWGEEIDGQVSIELSLREDGVEGDRSGGGQRGTGLLRIEEARLYRLPLILSILNVLNLSLPEEDAFHTVEGRFDLVGSEVRFNQLVLRGSAMALAGFGRLNLKDMSVDLRFVSVSPHEWARIPVLSELLEGAVRELVEIRVGGNLRKPRVQAVPFRGLEQFFTTLFPEDANRS